MTAFERRLYIGFAVLAALFTPLLIASFMVISQLESTQGDLITKNAEDVIEAERLDSLVNQEFALVQAFVLRGNSQVIERLTEVHSNFQATAATLLRGVEVEEKPDLLQEIRLLEDQAFAVAKNGVAIRQQGASIAQLNLYFESANLMRGSRMLQAVRENVAVQTTQLQKAREHADKVSKHLVWGLFSACAFALLATVAVVVLLYQMIRNKVREDADRDERLKLQEKISIARKEAVEVVAHDLKNPLSSMKMSLELLEGELADKMASNPDIATGFHIADRSVASMLRLIEDQLDHTRIESGQMTVERSLTNFSEVMMEMDLRFQPLAAAKNLELLSRIDRGLIANIDAARMEQVLSNVIGNALKFTPPGGSIEFSARRQADTIVVIVKDNGPGIGPDALEHVFERYWQVRETAKKGTGLGLSIAKGIVEAHGGKLLCRSELGHGTEFEVRLHAPQINRQSEMSH